MAENIMTPEFRVSYPNVFRPKRNDLSGLDEYSLVAIFDKKADLSALKKAAQEAIVAKWGEDKAKWPKNLRSPFRDASEREGPEYEDASCFMSVKNKTRPGLVDNGKSGSVQDIIDETEFYAGCYARATVRAFAYDQKGNRGVSFGLQNVQKLRDGEPLGGSRVAASKEFAPVASGAADDDIF